MWYSLQLVNFWMSYQNKQKYRQSLTNKTVDKRRLRERIRRQRCRVYCLTITMYWHHNVWLQPKRYRHLCLPGLIELLEYDQFNVLISAWYQCWILNAHNIIHFMLISSDEWTVGAAQHTYHHHTRQLHLLATQWGHTTHFPSRLGSDAESNSTDKFRFILKLINIQRFNTTTLDWLCTECVHQTHTECLSVESGSICVSSVPQIDVRGHQSWRRRRPRPCYRRWMTRSW